MTAPDVRTAAQAEAEATARFGQPDFSAPNDRTIKWATYVQAFGDGAVWGTALVTPTREQIAETIARSMPGWNDDTDDGPLTGYWERVNTECLRQGRIYADAVLGLTCKVRSVSRPLA